MLQDAADALLMTAANAIKRKNFLEKNIDLLPKGNIVMHRRSKGEAAYLHFYKDGKTASRRLTEEEAPLIITQTRQRQYYAKELQLIKSFLKSSAKQIQQAYSLQLKRSRSKMLPMPVMQSENPYHQENKIHISARKEKMRSRAEILVSDALIAAGLNYQYEKKLVINGKHYYPDFTVTCPLFPYDIYIEYCGLTSAQYVQRQHQKILEYERARIVQGINLLIIWERDGLLNASDLRELIQEHLTMERYKTVKLWLEAST